MTIQHVIYDLDGTLFDTEFEVSRITADLARAKGCNVTAEQVFVGYAGMGSREKFEAISQNCGVTLSSDEIEDMSHQHEERKAAIYSQTSIPLMPDAETCLQQVRDMGCRISLGSSNPSTRSKRGLDTMRLRHHFNERVYGPDMVDGLKKPDPAVFTRAIVESGIPAKNTAVIEDNETGITAGKRAGAYVVALLDPRFGEGSEAGEKVAAFRAAGADAVVRGLHAVPAVIRQVGKSISI